MQPNVNALLSLELPLHFVKVAVEREMAIDAQDLRKYSRVYTHLDIFRHNILISVANFIELASFGNLEKSKFFERDDLATNNIRQRISCKQVNR